ncbi:MAG TPA: TrkH family potassium uptake protein [Candidatus Hydrogenedentes bacterium]|nr:TrkH family potassium uptake protein [Candidatus Hydrogenedentota bacterium]HOH49994.1 TrkH family potassium uptake protein [Candidatus Hydrogenedentota bacterium]
MNYRLLLRYLGVFLLALALPLAVSALWAVWYGEWRSLESFLRTIVLTVGGGFTLWGVGRGARVRVYEREGLALVALGWLLIAGVSALPYVFAGLMDPSSAYFESMSGYTTTGASVLVEVEPVDKSLLFWRATTHWLGGMGIIVLIVAVLPSLGAGGKQLYRSEVPGVDKTGLLPRMQDTAAMLYKIYLGMTIVQTACLVAAGMSLFDALCHTFASLSTGGFSTRTASIGAYDSLPIEIIVTVFTVLCGANFGLYFAMLHGDWKAPLRSTEFRWYLGILLAATLLITVNLMGVQGAIPEDPGAGTHDVRYGFGHALRVAAFQVGTIMTTTGFATDNTDLWPYFSRAVLIALMIVGACSGSTAGGTKVFRVALIAKIVRSQLERLYRPKTVRAVRMNGAAVPLEVQLTVYTFFAMHVAVLVVGTMFMSLLGLPFQTAFSSVVATVNNIGPGMELVGSTANYACVPAAGKWFLSLLMVIGRLEFFSICVLFLPSFWRRA